MPNSGSHSCKAHRQGVLSAAITQYDRDEISCMTFARTGAVACQTHVHEKHAREALMLRYKRRAAGSCVQDMLYDIGRVETSCMISEQWQSCFNRCIVALVQHAIKAKLRDKNGTNSLKLSMPMQLHAALNAQLHQGIATKAAMLSE